MATATATTTTETQPTSTTLRATAPAKANEDAAEASASKPAATAVQTNDEDIDEENIYDEIEIEDMTYDASMQLYHYPCPCGDRFEIYLGDLRDGQEIAICPGCSLMIRVIYDAVSPCYWM